MSFYVAVMFRYIFFYLLMFEKRNSLGDELKNWLHKKPFFTVKSKYMLACIV